MEGKCQYCWRPYDYKADPRTEGVYHNEGCPVFEKGPLWEEWKRGYQRGFNWDFEGPIQYWNWKYYSKPFILGYRVGKEAIDALVDEIAQTRW